MPEGLTETAVVRLKVSQMRKILAIRRYFQLRHGSKPSISDVIRKAIDHYANALAEDVKASQN